MARVDRKQKPSTHDRKCTNVYKERRVRSFPFLFVFFGFSFLPFSFLLLVLPSRNPQRCQRMRTGEDIHFLAERNRFPRRTKHNKRSVRACACATRPDSRVATESFRRPLKGDVAPETTRRTKKEPGQNKTNTSEQNTQIRSRQARTTLWASFLSKRATSRGSLFS